MQPLSSFSLEISAAEVHNLHEWRSDIPDGTRVFVPHFRSRDFSENLSAVNSLFTSKLSPIPHLSARNIRNESELDRMIGELVDSGARKFLLVGGGENPPIGHFTSTLEMLETGLLQKHGISTFLIAGHPEKHPDVDSSLLYEALLAKLEYAQKNELTAEIVTQFCLSAEPFSNYIYRLNADGINVPIWLGMAGKVSIKKLVKFATFCGVGNSLKVFKKQASKMARLATYDLQNLLEELSFKDDAEEIKPHLGAHFYTFGAIRETLSVAKNFWGNSFAPMTAP